MVPIIPINMVASRLRLSGILKIITVVNPPLYALVALVVQVDRIIAVTPRTGIPISISTILMSKLFAIFVITTPRISVHTPIGKTPQNEDL